MNRQGRYPYLVHKAAEQYEELEERYAAGYFGAVACAAVSISAGVFAYLTDDPQFADVETFSSVVFGSGAAYFLNKVRNMRKMRGLEAIVNKSAQYEVQ